MRIATYNVENLDDKPDRRNPSLEQRAPVLRRTMERLRADILCLQEVHAQEVPGHTSNKPKRELSALATVVEGTTYAAYHQATTLTAAGVPYDVRNLVTLSAYPINQVMQIRNDRIGKLRYRKVTAQPPEEDSSNVTWERPILLVEIEHPELGPIHVINLHLKSRLSSNIPGQKQDFEWKSAAGWAEGYFLSSMKRVGQALETRVLVDEILDESPRANIVVCGDFNAEPGEVPVEAICGKVENTDNPSLQPRVLISASRGIPDSVRFSHLHHGQGNLLDHVLLSQSLLPYFNDAAIHNENLHDESLPFAFDTKYPDSDHAGFVAVFNSPM